MRTIAASLIIMTGFMSVWASNQPLVQQAVGDVVFYLYKDDISRKLRESGYREIVDEARLPQKLQGECRGIDIIRNVSKSVDLMQHLSVTKKNPMDLMFDKGDIMIAIFGQQRGNQLFLHGVSNGLL